MTKPKSLRSKSIVQRRRDALVEWWDRKPWPCVILSVDPGARAGYCLAVSGLAGFEVEFAGEIDSDSRSLERTVRDAVDVAVGRQLPLVVATEEWGRGGPLGISHWLSLGAQRGVWEREFRIEWRALYPKVIPPIARINVNRWRGRIGALLERRPASTDEWKDAARAVAIQIVGIDGGGDNAAEAILIGYFACRSDEVLKKLGKRHLKNHGYGSPRSLEESIRGV